MAESAEGRGKGNDRIGEVQQQVDEVRDVMQDNISTVIQQHEKLESIEGRAEDLGAEAHRFQKGSTQLKRMMWWRNFKLTVILAIIILVILGYILIPIIINATSG